MKKILIIEDEQEIGKMLERAFKFSGYDPILVGDGQIALDYLRANEDLPIAMVLDVVMPNMSGLDLLGKVKSEQRLKDIPIMILTNSFLKENAQEFLKLGADLYLVKIEHKAADIVDRMNKLIESKNTNK